MNHIVDVQGLRKAYPGFSLKDVHFTLPEGCITGFIGVNGAGKTTTLKCLLGLTRYEAGDIRIFGESLEKGGRGLRNRIGVVLDEGSFYEELTLEGMKRILAPAYSRWDEPAYRRYLDRFGLQSNQVIATLSKGMRMKYALALALSHHAELLIMDEPTSGLDPEVRAELLDILLEYMKTEGAAIFFSSHITSDLDKVADMLILIHDGQILFQEEKDALLERHVLVKGARRDLNEGNRDMFLTMSENDYGFTGLADNRDRVKRQMGSALLERPTVEDIMLAYIRR